MKTFWCWLLKPFRKSLDLVESLLRLSEVGQYEQVKQLFNFPIKHCPDMLVLALLQISTSWHTLRHELISTLMPIFLGNHPNSAIILHYAWHGQVGDPFVSAVNVTVVLVFLRDTRMYFVVPTGAVSFHSSAHHAFYGWVVHEGGAVRPGQALTHPRRGPGPEG